MTIILPLDQRGSHVGEPTWEMAWLYPAQGSWTEEEYLALDTNHLIEFADGVLEFLPMPTVLHQRLARFLFLQLQAFVADRAAGEVFFAPLPVRLRPGKYREPDIVYLGPERVAGLRGQPQGADLVMEVVSEGAEHRRRDVEVKRSEYAAAEIAEYWIVDPELRTVEVLELAGRSYRRAGRYAAGEVAASVLLPGFQVAVDELFQPLDSR